MDAPGSTGVTAKKAVNPLTDYLLHYFHKNNCPELFYFPGWALQALR